MRTDRESGDAACARLERAVRDRTWRLASRVDSLHRAAGTRIAAGAARYCRSRRIRAGASRFDIDGSSSARLLDRNEPRAAAVTWNLRLFAEADIDAVEARSRLVSYSN